MFNLNFNWLKFLFTGTKLRINREITKKTDNYYCKINTIYTLGQVNRNAKVANMFADCNKLMYLSNESVFPTEVEDATFMSLPTRGTCKVDLPFDSLEDYENAKGWRYLFIANAENETKLLGQQTTSISNMASVDEDEKIVFSFAGERLSAPVKGLNIIAGKKVMMK